MVNKVGFELTFVLPWRIRSFTICSATPLLKGKEAQNASHHVHRRRSRLFRPRAQRRHGIGRQRQQPWRLRQLLLAGERRLAVRGQPHHRRQRQPDQHDLFGRQAHQRQRLERKVLGRCLRLQLQRLHGAHALQVLADLKLLPAPSLRAGCGTPP